MNTRRIIAAAVAGCLLPLTSSGPASAEPADSYWAVEVVSIPDDVNSLLFDIADNGMVAGVVRTDTGNGSLVVGPVDAPQIVELPGPLGFFAMVNSAGDVVTTINDPDTGVPRGLVYDYATGTFSARGFESSAASIFGGIGDDGKVFFFEVESLAPLTGNLGLVDAAGVRTPLMDPPGVTEYVSLNFDYDAGWAVASVNATAPVLETLPVRWDPTGQAEVLAAPAGYDYAVAVAVNASGDTVGYAGTNDGLDQDPVRWDAGGVPTVLSTGPDPQGYAYGIASDGTVAGATFDDVFDQTGSNPVLWTDEGTLVDLRSRMVNTLPPDVGFVATASTASGIVVGASWQSLDVGPTGAWAYFPDEPVTTAVAVTGPATVGYQGSIQLGAQATLSDASTVDVTSAVSWMSSNPAVATVNSAGTVVGVAPGSVTISATYEGFSDAHAVTVTTAPTATVSPPAPRQVSGLLGTQHTITYIATVTSQVTNSPIPGVPVVFTVPGTTGCTALTNSSGVASCQVTYSTLSPLLGWLFPNLVGPPPPTSGTTFAATFAGTTLFGSSTGSSTVN